ncbi:nucleotide-binding protein [bacterium]|nr:nucleotide-binding protein [bacterium]
MDVSNLRTGEGKSIVETLSRQVDRGRNILDRRLLKPGNVKTWIRTVQFELRKVYGSKPEVKGLLPVFEGTPPEDALERLLVRRLSQLESFVQSLEVLPSRVLDDSRSGRVFIGHGRSLLWRELKDFVSERLGLVWDEFNREAVAGHGTWERLSEMLGDASFALLVMTAEDKHADATMHPRENVIHEAGLFQGRLGSRKAIILLEEGCMEFSNISGLSQIRFPSHCISAVFEDVRRVLERENILKT